MSKLSNKEYRACGGSKCPNCGSENIVGDSLTVEGSSCSLEVWCGYCGARWWDVYKLMGYDNLEVEQR